MSIEPEPTAGGDFTTPTGGVAPPHDGPGYQASPYHGHKIFVVRASPHE